MRFQVLTAASEDCLLAIALMIEAVNTCETSTILYRTSWRSVQKYDYLQCGVVSSFDETLGSDYQL